MEGSKEVAAMDLAVKRFDAARAAKAAADAEMLAAAEAWTAAHAAYLKSLEKEK